jgi:hypothetical protein
MFHSREAQIRTVWCLMTWSESSSQFVAKCEAEEPKQYSSGGAQMLQEPISFDLRSMTGGPSASMKVYMLVLLVVCIRTTVKLTRVWRGAPPLRLSRQARNPAYQLLLETSSTALKQWIGFTFLCSGILASKSLYDISNQLFDGKRMGGLEIMFVVRDFSTAFTMALLVVLFLFLVRWHMLERIEHLRQMSD